MLNLNKFYTYAYLRDDKTPYYIGKGSGDRINDKSGKPCGKPKDKSRIIFLKQNLTEEDAFKHEIYMIAVFGRKDLETGILRNRTNGGEGVSGRIVSEEEKEITRNKLLGRTFVKIKNLINQRFGLLLVIDELDRVRKPCGKPVRVFLCKCDCGNEKSIRISDLTGGKTISCGCKIRKHGKRNSRAYVIWRGMKARCLNPKATSYNNFGGAGVTIDERWLEFKNFYEDMGDPPDGMILDKNSIVVGNKVYGPGLCKWSFPGKNKDT